MKDEKDDFDYHGFLRENKIARVVLVDNAHNYRGTLKNYYPGLSDKQIEKLKAAWKTFGDQFKVKVKQRRLPKGIKRDGVFIDRKNRSIHGRLTEKECVACQRVGYTVEIPQEGFLEY